MTLGIREFTMQDYEAAYSLWSATPGMGLSEADEPEAIRRYLERNAGLSFVAEDGDGSIAGTVLCGHDGRRGYLYHLAVRPSCRGRGIGEGLAAAALRALAREGIAKCHIMVLADNEIGLGFWTHIGWIKREGLYLYSSSVGSAAPEDGCPC